MFRAATSNIARRAVQRSLARTGFHNNQAVRHFQATGSKFSDIAPHVMTSTAVAVPAKKEEEKPKKKFGWEPIYLFPLGLAFAVPAIKWDWYLVNEETQLLACFIAFCMIVHKNFGQEIYEFLIKDGIVILAERNAYEDKIIADLQDQLDDILIQEHIVQDSQDILAIQDQTYEKLNVVGSIKPQYDFKAQMERLLTQIGVEENVLKDKAKHALMADATAAVMSEFVTSDTLKKAALDNAIAQLKGGKTKGDPVQQAYVDFFKQKASSASQVDEKAELLQHRQAIVTRLNSIAMNEGFYFKLDEKGNPVMTA